MTLGSRALFPDLAAFAYLNHAAISPPSTRVCDAVASWLTRYAVAGVGAFPAAMEQRASLKAKLSTLLGCGPQDLAMTSGTSQGLIDVASCLPLRKGDRIVCFTSEFPANVTPWRQAIDAAEGALTFVPQEGESDEAVLEGLEQALKPGGVQLVAVSAVQFSTGRVMPLAEITKLAQEHGALVCVDAIQALGVMPFDVAELGVDFVAGGGHKWLMGVEGSGFLYARPDVLDRLEPRVASWLSHEEPLGFLLEGPGHLDYDRPIRHSIDFLEGHSQNVLGAVALEAALDLLLELGIDTIQAHVRGYNDALEDGLVGRGFTSLRAPGCQSGTLAVEPPPDVDVIELAHALSEHGVSVSTPDGKLRCSPHWPNDLAEVPRVLEVFDAVLGLTGRE